MSYIQSIKLKNYRNYKSLDLSLNPNVNIFYGDNAQGKTNILEAIFLAGTTKSHRGSKDRDIIQFGQEEAHIELHLLKEDIPYRIDMHLKKNKVKGIAINRVPIAKASELIGLMQVVFFSPEDLHIIKAGPIYRRRFMDLELSQLNRVYLDALSTYFRILKQRNLLLKDFHTLSDDLLDTWDEQLIQYGNKIIKIRHDFINKVNKIIQPIHFNLTHETENIELIYEDNLQGLSLEEALKKNRQRDLRLKNTTVGPHRDDFCVLINGMDVRQFGSQGQQRTVALSLKLSEITLIRETVRHSPILLLDDVLSELDKQRQVQLLDYIQDIQTLITCTGLDEFVNMRLHVDRTIKVKQGQVTVRVT